MSTIEELVAQLEDCNCDPNCDCASACHCEDVLDKIFELVDREIPTKQVHQMLKHSMECEYCRGRVERELAMRRIIRRGCCEQAPESLRMRIMEIVTHYEAN
ncbi:MAG: hypothetical protein Q4E03_02990 [Trueperella sp.]|nr:hypothetical protein [Trueperella sp.]